MNSGKFDGFDNPTYIVDSTDQKAKAWVVCTAAGVILSSYNVASVVQSGTGDITITWSTPFKDANYVSVTNTVWAVGTIMACTIIRSKAAATMEVQCYRLSAGIVSLADPDSYMIAVYAH